MTKKSRYFLILLGFTAFLILAPLIILYLRGLSFNFKTLSFKPTGILALVVDPNDSQVLLNQKFSRNGSGDINFLAEGEYDILIKKEGYLDWKKRLPVKEGQVTWVNPRDNKVRLFLETPKITNITNEATDFYYNKNKLVYLQKNNIAVSNLDNLDNVKNYPLPKPVNNILTVDNLGNNFALNNNLNGNLIVFNADSEIFYDISSLFKTKPKMQFSNGRLYALAENKLFLVSLEKKVLTPVLKNVSGFYFQNQDLYYIASLNNNSTLNISFYPYTNSQELMSKLPLFNLADLYVTFSKQIFILNEKNLYLANSSMDLISQNVTEFNFDSENPSIPISQFGQLDYYDTLGKYLNFVTRSSQNLNSAVIINAISQSFYATKDEVIVTELDNRNGQNSFTLYKGVEIKKFKVDNQGENLVVLDNGQLKSLTVR